jgi:hypothetical protein
VLLTHAYMDANERRSEFGKVSFAMGPDGNNGQQLWNKLVRNHANFSMTFNGHVGGDSVAYLKSVGDHGNAVHQMLFNSQFEARGGNGWLRVIEFLADGRTVRVRTYSTLLGVYRTDAANQFEFSLSPVGTPSAKNAANASAPQKRKRARARQASVRSK